MWPANGILTVIIAPLLSCIPYVASGNRSRICRQRRRNHHYFPTIGAFFIPTFVIAPLAGQKYKMLSALSSMCVDFKCFDLVPSEPGVKAQKD